MIAPKMASACMRLRSSAALRHCLSRRIGLCLVLLICITVGCAAFSVIVSPENEAAALRAIELYDQARQAEKLDNVNKAVELYRRSLDAYEWLPGTYNNLAMAELRATGDRSRALAILKRGAAVASELHDNKTLGAMYNNMGFIVRQEAPLSVTHCLQAIEYYNQALDAVPDFVDALFNKASALRAMKENPQAAELLYRVLQLRPDHHSALLDLGSIFFEWGDVDTAVQYQDVAISVAPSMALKLGIMHNKGHFLRASGALEEALRVHEDALAMAPTDPMALTDVVIARRPLCVWEHREELLDRMLVAVTKPNLAVLLPYDSTLLPVTNAIRKQLAVALSRTFRQSATLELLPLRDIAVTTEARRPLRVGYLSFDFRDHPMGHLTLGLLESHDVERVQVHCYSYGTNDKSEWRHRAERRCHTFVDGAALSDLELAQRIALDEVDILIDLMAHTTGARLGISALRPSRVNVNYLGFPGTMGASFTDFVLVDRFVVPPEYANDSMTEQIVYLPHTYQVNEYELDIGACSAADDECMRAIRREEGLPEDAVILCNFNTIDKMEPVSFGVWMNVLRQVPNSILWLLQPSKKHASRIERSLRREAEARGIDSSRIVFAPRVSKRRHLARITIADVFLDSFIYNAHSTASDALWANVPLLTLWGDSFPSRVAGSLLSNLIGVPDLVPTSIKEYENLGVLLASSPELRNRIRAELARHSFTAPLFDTKRTTADIETAYELMHDIRHRLNHAPRLQRYHVSVGSSQSDFLRSEDRTAVFVRTAVVSGMAKQESRQYTEAKSIYERILRSQPNEIDARHLLGVTLHQLGNHHQALEVLDEVRRSHPNVALFRYNLALVLLALHRVTAAKAELREALQLDPTYHAALFQLTDILLRESAFPDVTDMYDKLGGPLFLEHSDHSEHVPDDIREQALLQYSFALTKSSRSDDALRILRSMVERHPYYFRATYNLAAIFIERGYYSMGDEWQVRAAVNEARHAFSTRGQFFTKYKRPHARKVVVFYCHEYGQSWWDAWGPSSLRTGLGGSEEAVVYLSRELQRLGFWVEVYGDPPLEDITAETSDRESVKWYPHYAYDPDDREVDVFVAWRYHIALAVGALSRQKFFWVHDVPSEDATHSRLLRETVDGILCVSHFQASLFPTELQTKIIVTSNALDPAHFVELDRMARHRNHRFVYGSSPGRGLYDLLLVWPRIRTHIPDATLRVFYGFTPAFLSWGRRNIKDFQTWKQAIDQMLKQPGVDYVGLVDHGTLANEYASAGFYLYPTTYSETSCVSLMKAMANGAIPITSRFPSSALRETCGEFDLGPRSVLADSSPIDDHEWLDLWVRSIVDAVKHPNETEDLRTRMIQFARHKYQWANVAAQWRLLFTDGPV